MEITVDLEMIAASTSFWFKDQEEFRCPFPDYIKSDLKVIATDRFSAWVNNLSSKAKEEINDQILLERFEEILFEEALKMVVQEDEKISIKFPFMLRIGDLVRDKNKLESIVTDRKIIDVNDSSHLKVTLKELGSGKIWETSFDLYE